VEPRVTQSKTDIAELSTKLAIWTLPLTESEDPSRAKARTDSDEPKCTKSITDNVDPKRAMERSDSVDPKYEQSRTDKALPKRATPSSDIVEPMRIMFLSDNDEPT
jgi:hypothetical protein